MGKRVKVDTKKPEVKQGILNSQMRRSENSRSIDTGVERILFLQRTVGNQAVSRLMRSGALQAKLRIGQPGDKYEQEADRVADAVMRMPQASSDTLYIQKAVNEEEKLQKQPAEEEEEELQAKSNSGRTSEIHPSLESRIQSLKGGGQPLSANERTFFEPRFGRDFSQVRVHTDTQAAESAQAVNARAFTVGKDVVFGTEQYAPETVQGKWLLTHELTHVVQQIDGKKALTVCNTSILMRQTEVKKAGSAKKKAKGEKIVEDIKLKRKIAAIVLAESYPGQEKDIVWIYFNQWKSLREKGLKRSVAYKKKGMWYKVYMIALGDKTFENDKGTKGDPKKYKNLSEYVKKHNWFKKYRQKKIDKIMKLVEEVFKNPGKNPYKGWLGQGNLTDFNRNDGKWKKARQYFYLQNQKKVKKIFVKELPADKAENYSFIFDENKINDYFKKNPGMLPNHVKKYEL